jgi:hypothetical protein
MNDNFKALIEHVGTAVCGGLNLGIQYQSLQRSVTPHLLGETRDGRYVLHGFQFDGMTSKGRIIDPAYGVWRWFYLDEIEALATGAGPSYPLGLQKSEPEYEAPAFIVSVLAARK